MATRLYLRVQAEHSFRLPGPCARRIHPGSRFSEQELHNAKDLATQVEKTYPGAAASLRKGLEEMFALPRLGIDGRLVRR